jgi:type II secretory pathway pseudopilin PulG
MGTRPEQGVTLVELAVTLGLFALVMVGVVSVWAMAQQAYFVGSEIAETQQNTRTAIDYMVREIKAAGRDVTLCAFDFVDVSQDCDSGKVAAGGTCALTTASSWATDNTSNTNGSSPAGTGFGCQGVFAIPSTDVGPDFIRIRSDRNGNGTIVGMKNSDGTDPAAEDVRYSLEDAATVGLGGQLNNCVKCVVARDDGSGPVAMLAVDVNAFHLYYYPRPGYPPCDSVGTPPVPPATCPAFTLAASAPYLTQDQADHIARIRIVLTTRQTTVGQTISRTMVTDVELPNRVTP